MKNYYEIPLDFCGVPITVSGNYTAGVMSTWENPPFASEFEIDSIQINGVEINDLLDDDQYNEIVENCIDYIENL